MSDPATPTFLGSPSAPVARRTLAGRLLRLATLGALGLAACNGDSPIEPAPTAPRGEMSFSFSGAHSGTFQAEGEFRPGTDGEPAAGTWAAAGWDEELQHLGISAFRAHNPASGDVLALVLGGATAAGTVTLNGEECLLGEAVDCRMGWLGFDVHPSTFEPTGDRMYVIVAGTVTITTYTADRLAGTFTGTAVHLLDFSLGVAQPRTLTISNGAFDVPLFRDSPGGAF